LALGPFTEVDDMIWETPDFVEVKMDAEINSYQDDFDREQDDRF
jgi:coenzyme PQQ precursor peptide PqqA